MNFPGFGHYLERMAAVHTSKGKSYATDEDPFLNYRTASASMGLPVGASMVMRLQEKVTRLAQHVQTGRPVEEEECLDVAIIALLLHQASGDWRKPDSIEDAIAPAALSVHAYKAGASGMCEYLVDGRGNLCMALPGGAVHRP